MITQRQTETAATGKGAPAVQQTSSAKSMARGASFAEGEAMPGAGAAAAAGAASVGAVAGAAAAAAATPP